MRVLFIGDASAAHYNLALGLRKLGHEALVVSHRGGWRNHPCDVAMVRGEGKLGAISYLVRWIMLLPRLKGYDIVQFVGPNFMDLKAERRHFFYEYLRRHNRRIVLTALGDDYFWAMVNDRYMPFRYGDFNIGDVRRTNHDALRVLADWQTPVAAKFNRQMADDADAIVPVLYEYWLCYDRFYHAKTHFIPLPVVLCPTRTPRFDGSRKIRFFIGIQSDRTEFKGTDIMLAAARQIAEDYPDQIELTIAESVPYAEYIRLLEGQDIILDQLYSYTPAMNALIAMARGLVVIGGGEPENYEILGEKELRPIINVQPTCESCYHAMKQLVLHPERIPELQRQSVAYIQRHHDYLSVAGRYLELYQRIL